MEKTIKDLADELGVSKTAIRKKMTDEFREKYTRINGKTIYINDEGQKKIRETSTRRNNNKKNKEVEENTDLSVDVLDTMKKQLAAKDKQISELQKLLDQSQRLQLMAENKIKKIEENKTQQLEHKHWWQKIF